MSFTVRPPNPHPARRPPKPGGSAPPRLDLFINLTVSDRPLATAMQHVRDKLALCQPGGSLPAGQQSVPGGLMGRAGVKPTGTAMRCGASSGGGLSNLALILIILAILALSHLPK